ncbi:hypothetical protein [Cylindrospermopsis raciborskii]|nr:hypothetical protein [Cylindrospermopsis raciborskii]UJS06185.1 hypothetical protein L3I90_08225 [Cylindrospermopsis raciborskii KLL07]
MLAHSSKVFPSAKKAGCHVVTPSLLIHPLTENVYRQSFIKREPNMKRP